MRDITMDAGEAVMDCEAPCFDDLEQRFGSDVASTILKMLEQFEGIAPSSVERMTQHERFENVLDVMSDNMAYQTRH